MRFLIFILIFQSYSLFCQDTIEKMRLKPISCIQIVEMPEKENNKYLDSLNNSEECRKKMDAYIEHLRQNREKIIEAEKKVKDLNNQDLQSGFYYFIVLEYKPYETDFSGCGSILTAGGEMDFDIHIEKREKSRIIIDGTSGEVFYYEDLKRMPR